MVAKEGKKMLLPQQWELRSSSGARDGSRVDPRKLLDQVGVGWTASNTKRE
jgi:hypothetical protein